jgi:hypothetical protein
MKFRLLVFLAFEVLCGACTRAQDVADFTPVLRRGTTLVLVPTLIKTSSGEPVFGLTANDFILTDDGIEQKISLEENTDRQPLALVIVVQTGGAGAAVWIATASLVRFSIPWSVLFLTVWPSSDSTVSHTSRQSLLPT